MLDIIMDPKKTKSRKSHNCDECDNAIEKYETYYDSVLNCSGDLYHWRQHISCHNISLELPDDYSEASQSGEGYPPLWQIWEWDKWDIRDCNETWATMMVEKFGNNSKAGK